MNTHTTALVTESMYIAAPRTAVFPLLCPVREYEWIEKWTCTMIHSTSGVAEEGCVFQTQLPTLGPNFPADSHLDTWVVCRYCPPAEIAFVRYNGHRTIVFTIELEDEAEGTRLHWTHQMTGLTPAGNIMVANTTQEQFNGSIHDLEQMLSHFCTTGECLQRK